MQTLDLPKIYTCTVFTISIRNILVHSLTRICTWIIFSFFLLSRHVSYIRTSEFWIEKNPIWRNWNMCHVTYNRGVFFFTTRGKPFQDFLYWFLTLVTNSPSVKIFHREFCGVGSRPEKPELWQSSPISPSPKNWANSKARPSPSPKLKPAGIRRTDFCQILGEN